MIRHINFPVATILSNPRREWPLLVRPKNVRVAYKEIDVDWNIYKPENYLFTHVSILTSVATEENGYRIVEPCDELVNQNGNTWTNDVIQQCYLTFRGADVFKEHLQVPSLSKGKVLDAVLRPVVHTGQNGKTADVFTVDLLVATNRRHQQLVNDIESEKLKTLSMGCIASHVQCSFCGKLITDDDKNCEHLDNHLGKYLEDNGKKYIVSELCGGFENGVYIPDSCHFIEASWVGHPAFKGAVVNHFVETEDMKVSRIDRAESNIVLGSMFEEAFNGLRVADASGRIALKLARQELMVHRVADEILKRGV